MAGPASKLFEIVRQLAPRAHALEGGERWAPRPEMGGCAMKWHSVLAPPACGQSPRLCYSTRAGRTLAHSPPDVNE